jgi:competence transcription factor ComK
MKTAWLSEQYISDAHKLAYTKTNLILINCNTKPVNVSNLFQKYHMPLDKVFIYHPPLIITMISISNQDYSWSYYLHPTNPDKPP